ncbi:hypothetical protein GTQ99_00355 [Kineococcus sp. T13]|uniref:hypothetical protein n=1 Tax=Kineococcus vitellinus TaxID=2696565 RepID=UPI0014129D31|nr:hypothetical protein [Kineococcus vitellinus]NAZ73882.1 hypothetical protein [Kineococcus vitellinus]
MAAALLTAFLAAALSVVAIVIACVGNSQLRRELGRKDHEIAQQHERTACAYRVIDKLMQRAEIDADDIVQLQKDVDNAFSWMADLEQALIDGERWSDFTEALAVKLGKS